MPGPPSLTLEELIERLEDRSYKTYVARLQAHKRLNQRNNAWNSTLISLSTAATVASVGLLVNKDMYGPRGEALMVAIGILSLVASLVVSSVSYGTRSRAMEANYKRMQQISLAAEDLRATIDADALRRYRELRRDYEIAVESSENHSTVDHLRAQESSTWRQLRFGWRDSLVTMTPYATLVIPMALLVPFVAWFLQG